MAKKGMGKREWLLLGTIFVLASALFAYSLFRHSAPAAFAEVALDGEVVQKLSMDEDADLVIESHERGETGTNRLIIKDREAWIEEASCPDKICVHQGKISTEGEMIVCLPHRMTVRIVPGD